MNKLFRVTVAASFLILVLGTVLHAETDGNSYAKWRGWIHAKQDYLGSIELVMKDARDIAILQEADLDAAVRNKDKALGEKVIADTTKKLSKIVDELKALAPPEEFKDYHQMVIESYKYRQMANEATFNKDMLSIRDYGSKAALAEIEAMQYIRQLYIKHSAPPQVIDSIDAGIMANKRALVSR